MIRKTLLLSITLGLGIQQGHCQGLSQGETHKDIGSANSQLTNSPANGDMSSIYSVDLYSGTANVTVPIYSYNIDGLNLGISVGYNTKGIKVDQPASPVGLGWDISAGASITRQVNGIEDEVTLPPLWPDDPHNPNHPIVASLRGSWCEFDNVYPYGPINTADDQTETAKDLWQINLFGRTIKFSYNPGGYMFGWQVVSERNVTVDILYNGQPLSALNIYQDRVPSDATRCIGQVENGNYISFVVTDEQSNKFYFEPGEHEKRVYQDPRTSQKSYYYPVTKWVLTKIISFSGQEVDYTYHYYNNISFPTSQYQEVRECNRYTYTFQGPAPTNTWFNNNINFGGIYVVDSTAIWTGTICNISEIKYPNGVTAAFDYDNVERCDMPGQYALKSVKIQSAYDDKVKNSLTYAFNYAYFNSPNQNNNNLEVAYPNGCNNTPSIFLRLKLKSIDKLGTDLVYRQRYYSFNYNTTPLPERTSYMQDYYGYYNHEAATPYGSHYLGVHYHSSTLTLYDPNVGDYQLNVPAYGMSKSPNFTYTPADLLTEVENGMGGKATFYYKNGQSLVPNNLATETYEFSNYANNPAATSLGADPELQYTDAYDGVCIDKIVNFDGFSPDNSTTTQYDFYDGERFFMGGYFWFPSIANFVEITYRNALVSPQNYPNGFNHGFRRAIVTTKGTLNEQLSKTQYWFSGKQNLLSPTEYNLKIYSGLYYHQQPESYIYSDYLGLNTQTVDYDKDGYPISKRENVFDYPSSYINPAPPLDLYYHTSSWINTITDPYKFPCLSGCTDGFANHFSSMSNSFITLDTILVRYGINTHYSHYTEYKDTMYYAYWGNTGRKTSESWFDSKWRPWMKKWAYNGGHLQNMYLERDNHNPLLSGYKTDAQAAYPGPSTQIYRVETITKNFDQTAKTIKYYHFDDKNNVIESIRNNFQDTVSYVWDTKIDQKACEVVNSSYDNIAYTSFEGGTANFNPSWAALDYNKGNWIFDPTNISCYLDQNGNPVSDKPITGSYYYNLLASSQFITYKNLISGKKYLLSFWTNSPTETPFAFSGATNQVFLTQQAHVGTWYLYSAMVEGSGVQFHITNNSGSTVKIDELRLHPEMAGMDTYTYQPLFGVSSHCDERNNITYYEYDALGHLKVVRDIDGNVLSLTKYITAGADN